MTFKDRAKSFFMLLAIVYGLMILTIPIAMVYEIVDVSYWSALLALSVVLLIPASMSVVLFLASEGIIKYDDLKAASADRH